MAARRKVTKTKKAPVKRTKVEVMPVETPVLATTTQGKLFSKQVLIGAIVVALALLVFYKKHWFIAATVNNLPVLSPQVVARLYTDYRSQAVNEIIDERIIMAEA